MGFAVFNQSYVELENYQSQIATFVHEVLHALYFHPKLFRLFPANADGESFLFRDARRRWKLRGDNVLYFLRSHFDCPAVDGGTRCCDASAQGRQRRAY